MTQALAMDDGDEEEEGTEGTDETEELSFPELVDIEKVAKLLGVGQRYVRRMVAERRVPTVKIGHYVRFDLDDIRKWVEGQRRPKAS